MRDVLIINTSGLNFDGWISIIVAVVIGVGTLIFMWVIFRREQNERKKEIRNIQISLLHSLLVELNAISSPLNNIRINQKDYTLKGNLEWYEEILSQYKGKNITPSHNAWRLNTDNYLSNLHNKIDGKSLIELKKLLILINQKLELIKNYFDWKIPQNKIEEVIKETKGMVKDSKDFLREKFNIDN